MASCPKGQSVLQCTEIQDRFGHLSHPSPSTAQGWFLRTGDLLHGAAGSTILPGSEEIMTDDEDDQEKQRIDHYETLIHTTDSDSDDTEYVPVSYINLIKLYLEDSNIQKAYQYITEFNKNYPNHFESENLYASLIEIAFEVGNISFAVDELQKFQIELH